jgi:hypothetical protein
MKQRGKPKARNIQTLMELSYKLEFPHGISLTRGEVGPPIILLVYPV